MDEEKERDALRAQVGQLTAALRGMVKGLDPNTARPPWVYPGYSRDWWCCRYCAGTGPGRQETTPDDIEHFDDCPVSVALAILDREWERRAWPADQVRGRMRR